jgi:glyoxylase-like metal-dependent hydrolase (beta-lactamase superfamily II)
MTASLPPLLGFPFETPPAPGATVTVAEGVLWLRMPLPFALDHINLWLLDDGAGWTLIDCGYGDEPTRTLWARHLGDSLRGRPLTRIVATHYHPDHLGNAAWLAERFDCPLYMAQAEFLTAHAVGNAQAGYDTEAICALFAAHGMAPSGVEALRARGNRYRRGVPELPRNYRRLLAGDRLHIGGHDWTCFAGYGHSPEHMALHAPALGVCISGDMLLPKITTNVSVWPAEPDGDPLRRFLDSIDAFAALPPATLILPSHGLPFVGAATRVGQLAAHHAARLSELEQAITATANAGEMLPVLFRRPLDVQQSFFAMGEAIAHLNHLWHVGRLLRIVADDGTVRFHRPSFHQPPFEDR